ncbi:hypothetical protein [Glaciihabitans sp. UYNi722]|uniref:hypothetical protein n=1 Tax=Glaciihabitans sp. UYNi722 TaxID=3156344 RepID=UPI0033946FFA
MAEAGGWREPTSRIPLRWGGYRSRYLAALILILAGALLVQATSAYTDYFLTIGLAAHVLGWLILPGRGGRRLAAALPSALLVGLLLLGSIACVLLVVALAFWFLVRQRPAVSYLTMLLPLISGLVLGWLYPQYGDGGIVVGVSMVVIVGSAWLGQSIAKSRQIPSNTDARLR